MSVRQAILLSALLIGTGCQLPGASVPVEPGATFSSHEEHHRLVIDHAVGGRSGAVVPSGWFRRPGDPTFIVRRDGDTVAALWIDGPGRVRVGAARSAANHLTGRVDPTWEDGAIRLTLTPAAGSPLRVGPFRRVATGGGPSTLTRQAQTVLDVRGAYQADLLDAAGKPVGWWRVRIGPYLPAPRIYDAVLPAEIDLGLAAATAVAIGGELDWIEGHVLDVYRGDSSGGSLERSIPLGNR